MGAVMSYSDQRFLFESFEERFRHDAWVDATGDVVAGDVIRFSETVWCGSLRKPRALGEREITAEVLGDSYGEAKQQHTFTLQVLSSTGYEALAEGTKTHRKGRNVYRNGTQWLVWLDEAARHRVAEEKHSRGDAARAVRRARKEEH